MSDDQNIDHLVETIRPLAEQIVALKQQMKHLSMFTNDRELLQCPRCGLMEDVTAEGLLITCREPDLCTDTGLRFVAITDESYRCPSCGQTVQEPLSENELWEGLSA
jgi:predicted RNA-binding Zn-ribbon protein involved in translation (DUF1610 family)